MNRGAGRAPRAIAMEFAFHNRFFRPALPPLRRALIQTGVSLCSVPKVFPPLFCTSRARRSSTTGNITDYFVRPRSPSRPAFPPFSAHHPCRTDSGPDRGHKDADICDGHRDAITCAIRHAGPLPRRLRCTSRLRMSRLVGSGPWARGPRLWAWARGPRLWAWGPGLWALGFGPWAWGPRLWALGLGPRHWA